METTECDCGRCRLQNAANDLMEGLIEKSHAQTMAAIEKIYPMLEECLGGEKEALLSSIRGAADHAYGMFLLSFIFAILNRSDEEMMQVLDRTTRAIGSMAVLLSQVRPLHRTVRTIEMMREVENG